MTENDTQQPNEVLKDLLNHLQSDDIELRLNAISKLHSLNYSSDAIRNELEKLALHDNHPEVRKDALAALDLPSHRHVRSRINKLALNSRSIVLNEITEWEKFGLLDKIRVSVLRKRYDFDAAPQLDQSQPVISTLEKIPAPAAAPSQPAEPRPTLMQTLLSEASIKIYLYLGAFFVIASASIIGAAVPELRLPILLIGTLTFGGLSLALKKRLPQPSFALFIVFSFLLPITANTIEESLLKVLNLGTTLSVGYWVFIFFFMAVIWSSGTWFYESRLFSITAFISFTLAFIRIGNMFNVEPEFFTTLTGFAASAGLGGVFVLKKWRDTYFALPLFLTVQLLQVFILISTISIFGINSVESSNASIWHLASFTTCLLAFGFYIFSELLIPFILFRWLAAATLIPLPWFIITTFQIESLGSAIILLIWGTMLTLASETAHKLKGASKYDLPILLASMPTFAITIFTGFSHNNTLGMFTALGIALIYAGFHLLRTRWWLWTLALLSFIISYFAFFNLEFIQVLDVFIGYQLLGISILFLLPDLFLKKDLLEWRLPPRIYGTIFTFYTSIIILAQNETQHVALCFAIYTVFFITYAFAQRKAIFGYIPAAFLPLTILFAMKYFEVDAWLLALTVLTILYFVIGFVGRSKESWSFMLRNSALVLGSLISFAAIMNLNEIGSFGWCSLIIGLLFMAEMYLRRNGLFEAGAPILFSIGAFLILRDLNYERVTHHVFVYSQIWILTDLLAHLTYTNPRPLKMTVRIAGSLFAIISYVLLITESYSSFPAIGFGVFTLLFLAVSLLYRQPNLFYTFTLTLPIFVTFVFREFGFTKWIHPVIVIAVIYCAAGFFLRSVKRAEGWDTTLLYSGLGLGLMVSVASPILGGLDAAIPVAIAATLWAFEAFARKNVWLAFPANGLYLLGYFIILYELKVDEPQFYSIGAALLGLIQHYLLVRSGSKSGAFITGMVSQFVLLGTTYIEMLNKVEITYFFVLFFQSLIVMVYGLVFRSRSLTFFPIGFVALGVITIVSNALEGVGAIFVIGCTGILLLILGVFAVLMRERISQLSEKISDWKA